MKAHQRVLTWPSPWRQLALLILLVLTCIDRAAVLLVRRFVLCTRPIRLAILITLLVLIGCMVGCAGATPYVQLREKPPHTCTGFVQCFGQLWIGFTTPF